MVASEHRRHARKHVVGIDIGGDHFENLRFFFAKSIPELGYRRGAVLVRHLADGIGMFDLILHLHEYSVLTNQRESSAHREGTEKDDCDRLRRKNKYSSAQRNNSGDNPECGCLKLLVHHAVIGRKRWRLSSNLSIVPRRAAFERQRLRRMPQRHPGCAQRRHAASCIRGVR